MLAHSLQPWSRARCQPAGSRIGSAPRRMPISSSTATSAGMKGNPPLALDLAVLKPSAAVLDIVYNPLETELLQARQGPRSSSDRWAGHADAPGGAVLRSVLRRQARSDAGSAHPPGSRSSPMPKPFVIGLTGSIGMGKSETAKLFAAEGIPVHDADAVIARLYGKGGAAVAVIARAFPGAVQDGTVDRARLSALVLNDKAALEKLEGLVHPLVAAERDAFLQNAKAPIVLFDMPLLFETGAQREEDAIVVVSAPEAVQRARVLARPGMTAEKFESLKARQLRRCAKASTGALCGDDRQGLGSRPRSGENDPGRHTEQARRVRVSESGKKEVACVRSSSILKPPALSQARDTGSLKSAWWSWWIISPPARASNSISTRNGTCPSNLSAFMGFQANFSATSRSSPMSRRNFWSLSATPPW